MPAALAGYGAHADEWAAGPVAFGCRRRPSEEGASRRSDAPGSFSTGERVHSAIVVGVRVPIQSSLRPARHHSEACLRGASDSADAGTAAQVALGLSGSQEVFLAVDRELRLPGPWESIPARNRLKAEIRKTLPAPEFVLPRIMILRQVHNDRWLKRRHSSCGLGAGSPVRHDETAAGRMSSWSLRFDCTGRRRPGA